MIFFSHKSAPFLWILPSQFSVLASFCFTNSKMCFFFWGGDELICRQEAAGVIDLYFIGGGGRHREGLKEQWVAFGLFLIFKTTPFSFR